MRILKIDRKNNYFEVIADNFDDLWHIEKLIEPGDVVSGSSERKIKPKQEGDKPRKEKVFVEIEAERAEFHEASNQLRVQGIVLASKPEELVELRSHHTLEVEPGAKIAVRKKALKNYHIERLERAKKATGREKILAVIMDDDEAEIYAITDTGAELKVRILSGKTGKRYAQQEKGNTYFDEILKKASEGGAKKIVVAGPGFEKQKLDKYARDKKLGLPIIVESVNDVGTSGLNELMNSGKVDKLLEGMHSAEEAKAVERVLIGLGNGMSAIGLKEVKEAVQAGAAEEVVVQEKMVSEKRQEAGEILDAAEQLGTKVTFVASKSDAGKKLGGLGGIAAVLRYRMKW